MGMKGMASVNGQPHGFPSTGAPVNLSSLSKPRFLVTVDTEEEFDWTSPFTRDQHGVTHLGSVETFQLLCQRNGVIPLYLVDYPIAASAEGAEIFGRWAQSGVAEIGLQLHPWVNPPFVEEVSAFNSYASNLPPSVERDKLRKLFDIVGERIGVKAQSYRAGRYGAGAATAEFLCELGIRIDSSVRSLFDYTLQGGPNYARSPLTPYWVRERKLLELPVTSVFGGRLRSVGPTLFDQFFASDTMRSLLARCGLLERIALTPEGIPVAKAIEAIDIAVEANLPVLTFSFHSPSLAVGHTPYVRTAADLDKFYEWWELVFAHLSRRGIQPTSIGEIVETVF